MTIPTQVERVVATLTASKAGRDWLGRRARDAQAVAAESGGTDATIGVIADITDEHAVTASIDAALMAFDGLGHVVNKARLSVSKPMPETTPD